MGGTHGSLTDDKGWARWDGAISKVIIAWIGVEYSEIELCKENVGG